MTGRPRRTPDLATLRLVIRLTPDEQATLRLAAGPDAALAAYTRRVVLEIARDATGHLDATGSPGTVPHRAGSRRAAARVDSHGVSNRPPDAARAGRRAVDRAGGVGGRVSKRSAKGA